MKQVLQKNMGSRPNVKTLTQERATLSPRESVRITGFGVTQTYKLLKSGVIPSIKVGKQFFIPRVALMRWLETCGAEKFD